MKNLEPTPRLRQMLAASALALATLLAGAAAHAAEPHLSGLTQLTFKGENAEAYWSPDGALLSLQSTHPPLACDQIFVLSPDRPGEMAMVSDGSGRTTCAHFTADGKRILYSSTQLAGPQCPPTPDHSQGYVWALYSSYEIFSALPDGGDRRRLTDNDFYDAEATVCPVDGSIVFTSTRDGDLELYRMDADGGNILRLTDAPGYDGGAFFSRDCSRIVWRAARPRSDEEKGEAQELLERGLVRPGRLEIWVADADGTGARQVTYLDAASFAPSFFPDGKRIIFSSNHGDAGGREFELWAVNIDGTGLERITDSPGFDGFPLFSPDGARLAFSSNRNQANPGDTNVFVADWIAQAPPAASDAADRYMADVSWLAADAREGRGLGTDGMAAAADWLERSFRDIGLAPAGADGGYRQSFTVPVDVASGPGTALRLNGRPLDGDSFIPLGFSATGSIKAPVVFAGYGLVSPEHGIDDYAGVDATDSVVLVRRYTPEGGPFEDDDLRQRLSDLRYKAFTARNHGAVGMLVVDLPEVAEGEEAPEEAPLPTLRVDTEGDAGLAVAAVTRAVGEELLAGRGEVEVAVELLVKRTETANIIGRIKAAAPRRLPGSLVLGAHYDHLGYGGPNSLAPDVQEVHNGADDNASGTAALLAAARDLAARRDQLARDILVIAFSAEESGILGSTLFVRQPPETASGDMLAMLNFDMVGRLRNNRVNILGGDSAVEWPELALPACLRLGVECNLGGEGYGPSDLTPFYAAGVPVLYFFTGAHDEYHKPSDDADLINAAGGARIAALAAEVAMAVAARAEPLTYKESPPPPPQGDQRSYGASLGTVPDYAGLPEGRIGVLLAGVRAGSAAEKAGMQRDDVLVELAGREIRDIHDFVFVLREAKPGQRVTAVVERQGRRVELDVTFDARTRPR